MERGFYRGSPSAVTSAPRRPKRLARAENNSAPQTGVTNVLTDITGLAIGFSVTEFPVRVRLWVPFLYGSVSGDTLATFIADSANNSKQSGVGSVSGVNGSIQLLCEEVITVPGTYTRKGRFWRNSGTGTANTYMDATFVAYIEAEEFEV